MVLGLLLLGGSLSMERYDLMSELSDDVLDALTPLMRNSQDPDNWVVLLGEFAASVGMRDSEAYLYTPVQREIDQLTVGWVRRACGMGRP